MNERIDYVLVDPDTIFISRVTRDPYDGKVGVINFTVSSDSIYWGDHYNSYLNYEPVEILPITSIPSTVDLSFTYDLSSLPSGSIVKITNEDGDDTLITELTGNLSFADPGKYTVNISTPLNYSGLYVELEVTDA